MQHNFKHFETAVIHSGYSSKEHLGSLSTPIYQTSTFSFETAKQGENYFSGEEKGFMYSRLGNPTVSILEKKIAELEGGDTCLAFSSGMAAISAVLFYLTKANDHILCSQGVYGCTYGLLRLLEEKYNIRHSFSSMETEEEMKNMIRPETACIFIETPINPTMKVIDLEKVVNIAKEFDIPIVVDNTFCTPYLQKPLAFGCDFVIHSATKYLAGHGDVICGLAIGQREQMEQIARSTQKDIGGVLSPFDAWLLLRGLKTLPIRMDRHSTNAMKIVTWLKSHPFIKHVYYPMDASNRDYAVVKKQMSQGAGIISFEVDGTKEEIQAFLNQLKLVKLAVSLGDTESLIQHPATMTHSVIPKEVRYKMGISDQLIRLSVGLEAWEDIRDDLKQGLDIVFSKK